MNVEILETFYYYDGPLIFKGLVEGEPHYFHMIDMEEDTILYMYVPLSEEDEIALIRGGATIFKFLSKNLVQIKAAEVLGDTWSEVEISFPIQEAFPDEDLYLTA